MKNKSFYRNNYNRSHRITVMLFIWCFLLSTFLFISACDIITGEKSTNTDDSNIATGETVEESSANDDKIIAEESDPEADEENTNGETAENAELLVNVYYSDSMGEYLVGEAKVILSENKYIGAFYELMKLPTDSSLVALVPDTTIINSIVVEEGTAKIDLSIDFVEDRFISDTVDIMLVYSIVNTLTEFNEVNSVIFYIDGEKLDILGGLDLQDPVFRRSDLIK